MKQLYILLKNVFLAKYSHSFHCKLLSHYLEGRAGRAGRAGQQDRVLRVILTNCVCVLFLQLLKIAHA